jgi:hypothetical protein
LKWKVQILKSRIDQVQWLMPVILATGEAEIRSIIVQSWAKSLKDSILIKT